MSAIAQNGKTLELNTRFLTHTPNWNNALITTFRWFREAGGRQVAINSDAHRISEIGRNMDIAQKLLVEAGFKLPEQLFRVESRVVALA